MHQVEVDVEERVGYLVSLPDLVEQSGWHLLYDLLSPAAITARKRVSTEPGFSK